jgi:transcriptional regulator with XRE-family HTH domain
MKIGEIIKSARIAKNYSDKGFAHELPVCVSYVRSIENGTMLPGEKTFKRICDLLDLSYHTLLQQYRDEKHGVSDPQLTISTATGHGVIDVRPRITCAKCGHENAIKVLLADE